MKKQSLISKMVSIKQLVVFGLCIFALYSAYNRGVEDECSRRVRKARSFAQAQAIVAKQKHASTMFDSLPKIILTKAIDFINN